PGVLLQPSPVASPSQDGRVEVFAVGVNGALWHIWQTAVNGAWSNWVSHGTPPGGALQGTAAMAASQDGRLELFVVAADGALWHIWQTAVNRGWSDWVSH